LTVPAADTSYGRDRAAKLDPTAADTSRNEITMKGPVDYSAKTDELLGSGRTIANARWEDLLPGAAGEVLRNGISKKCAWERPTPVQQASIAAARIKKAAGGMMSPHIIGQAENGAGKTGAFCIASLIRCGKPTGNPNVLIIVPK
jgi:superfamily II DNA/RNA helicase